MSILTTPTICIGCASRRSALDERNRTPGCVALSDQNELVQSFAKTQSLQRYSRTCSGDSDSANTVTRYCAIGFSRDRNITCHERATFNKGLLASIAKSR